MMKKTAFFLLLSLFAASTFAAGPQEVTLYPPDRAIPVQLFGMHIHHLLKGARERTQWPVVSFGSWRLWGTYTYWARLEPKKGKWDFSLLDKYVDMAEQHHVEVLLTLGITPEWASSRSSSKSNFGPGGAAMPKTIDDWRNYVRKVATRYKGRIHEYEIWNEPNISTQYNGSISEMVQLARVAYQTLKQVDPTITVCSPSPTHEPGVPWLNQYLKAGGGKYADVIAFHLYVDPEAPERMVPLIRQVEQVMAKDGAGDKPLWDTETGYLIQNKQSVVPTPPHIHTPYVAISQDLTAAYVARTYILSWSSGVSRLYWYAWDNWYAGLVEPDGKTLKPPAIAYGQMENWLVGATMTSCGSNAAGTWTCAITRPGGYRGWIMWNPGATRHLIKFHIPNAWHVTRVRDLLGHTSHLAPGATFEVSIMPHLLETLAK